MKQLTTLLLLITISLGFSSFGQLSENFDGAFLPIGWTQTSGAGSYDQSSETADHTNGTSSFARYDVYNINGTTPAYLQTPKLTVSATDKTFSFWANYYLIFGSFGSASELYVDVSNDDGTTWTTGTTNYIAGQAGNGWNQIIIDLSSFETVDFTGDEVIIRFESISDYGSYNIGIDDVSGPALFVAACPAPTTLEATNITTTSADLGWVENGSAATWDIEHGVAGFTQGAGSMVTGTGLNPYSLSGLSNNTSYDFYVRADCGGAGVSSWVGPFTFTTLCAALSPPQLEDFSTGVPPTACWNQASGGDPVSGPTTLGSSEWGDEAFGMSGGTGAARINLYNTGTDDWLIAPDYDLTAGGPYQIEFDFGVFGYNSTTPGTLGSDDTIQLLFSTNGGATWTVAATFNNTYVTAAGGNHEVFDLTALSGSTVKFAVWATEGATDDAEDNDIFVDNVEVKVKPACSVPNALSATNITANSADLNWTENGTATVWDIEFGTSGFTQGAGTIVTSTTSNPYSATSLQSNTAYDFYVRADCGASGSSGQSAWAGPFTFSTTFGINCPTGNQTAVFTEEFDNAAGWTGDIVGSPSDGFWVFPFSGAPGSGNGPTSSHSGSNYMYVETSGSGQPYTANAISPLIDLSVGVNAAVLTFYYHAFGADVGTLDVGVSASPTGPWTSVLNLVGQQQASTSAAYSLESASLNAFLGQQIYIRFNYVSGNSFSGDVAVDLMNIYTCITCPRPTALAANNITDNSADLSWTAGGAETTWEVEHGISGYTVGTGTSSGSITTNSYALSGLLSARNYDYYVRGVCGAGDSSGWAGPFTFTTTCSAPLNGAYTINAGMAASTSNFTSPAAVRQALGTCGISGSVTFTIASGTYNGSIELSAISGASATNTITFDGSDSSLVEFTHTSSTDEPTIYFNGAKHITIQNITVSNNSSTDAWGIMFQNSSDSNTINQVHVKMPVGTATDVIGIVSSNSLSFETSTGNNVNYLTVSNSLFSGGETGIHLTGGSANASHNVGNRIMNNTFRMQDDHAIEVDGQDSLLVQGNNVADLQNSGADAMYLQDVNYFSVLANTVNSTGWGLYIIDGNDGVVPTSNSEVINNMVTSGSDDAIYLNDAIYINVYHNSAQGLIGLLINDDEELDIRNNIFASTGDYAFESTDAMGASTTLNYNLYYRSDVGDLVEDGTTVYTDLATWQAGDATRNVNSIEGNPAFVGTDDLHSSGQLANNAGDATVAVTTDIDGDTRSATTPDIGADEYTPPTCPNPFDLTAANATGTTVELSWTAGFTETTWNIEYGAPNFVLGSGTAVNGVTNNNAYVLSNLSVRTNYDVYVQADCGGGDLSTWFGPVNFTTDFRTAQPIICGTALASTIFTEEFDAVNGWTGDLGSSGNNWEIPGNATSGGTGPSSEYSGPSDSYMNYEASGAPTGDSAIVFSPAIDLTTASLDAELSFWMHAHGSDMGTLKVGVGNSLSGTFTTVFTHSGELQTSETDPWQNIGVDITAFVGQTIYLRFTQVHDGASFEGDMSIDLIEINACVSCPRPSALAANNITDNSADLSWTAGNTETTWEVEYGFSGYTFGTGISTGIISTNPYALTNLLPASDYDYYVRAVCGAGDSSLWAGPFTFTTPCSTPLAGTYTINSALATGGTNFVSFAAAANALGSCGISGPVTFNVAMGTYSGTTELTAIPGASAINTITFDGTDSSMVELTHVSTDDEPTIYFNGAKHVTIQNITVSNTSTSDAWGIMFQNGADSNTINQVHVKMPVTTTFEIMGLVSSNSLSSATSTGNNANYLTVSNSLFSGGETGILLTGGSANASHNIGHRILNNTFRMQDDHAIEVDGQDSLLIEGNDIADLQNSGADAMYLQDVNYFSVLANTINSTGWGLYITDGNDGVVPTSNSEVINNMVTSSSDDAIYLNDAIYINVYHNSAQGLIGLLINDDEELDIRNNIFASNGNFAFESTDAIGATTTLNYNLYYRSDAGDLADDGNAAYADLTAWQAGDLTRNTNSVEGNPFFVSSTDLHVFGVPANNAGTSLAGVTTDIDGETRSIATPDIGADEYDVALNDAQARVVFLDAPNGCPVMTDTVRLGVFNGGATAITSLPVTFIVSGDIQDTVTNTVLVNIPAFTADTVLAGVFDSRDGGNFTITAYTQLANDEDNSNDTVTANGGRFRVVPVITDVSCNGGMDGMVSVTLENAQGLDGSLTTSFIDDNGANGNMFDINVLGLSLDVSGFDVNINSTASTSVEVYYKQGTYVGDENNASAWIFAGSVPVTAAGAGQPTRVTLPTNIVLPNGIHSFFLYSSSLWRYYNGNGVGTLEVSNSDLEIFEGIGRGDGFGTAINSPRVFSGSIIYRAGEPDYVWSNGDTTATNDTLTAGTYTLTTTDGNGCVSNISVTVNEPTPLAISKTVSNASCLANTDGSISINASGGTAPYRYVWNGDTIMSTDTTNLGVGQYALTLLDANNCSLNDTTNIIVEDTIAPVVNLMPFTAYLDASGNASIDSSDVNNGSTDACGIATIALDVSTFTCSNVGANTVTATITDVNGNSTTGTSTITVLDTISPMASAQALTTYLDASGNTSITAADINAGSTDACGIASLSINTSSFTCVNVGVNTVTLTVTDNNGNSSVASAAVTVLDTIDPTVSLMPITVYLNAFGNANITGADVDAGTTDNCAVQSIALSQSAFTCANVGSNTIVATATDANGNTKSASTQITVLDTISPAVLVSNIPVYLNAAGNASITASDVDNSSTDACGIASVTVSKSNFNCGDVGVNTVSLTVTDNNGNASSANATLTVIDTINPTVQVQAFTAYLNATGNATVSATDVNNGSSDACGIQSIVLAQTAFGCADVGVNTILVTVTDVNGNSSSANASITILDTIDPDANAMDIDVYLDGNGSATIAAADVDNGSADACGIASLSIDLNTFGCANQGANLVVLTVTDINGNIDTAHANVTVIDTISPTITTNNFTAYLDASGNVSIQVLDVSSGSSNACSIDNVSLDISSFTCADLGANTVTVTASAGGGTASNSATAIVTVVDTISPTVVTQMFTTYLNAGGQASIIPANVDGGSTDNCSVSSLSVNTSSFDCTNLGANTVQLTVTDQSGNSSTASAMVMVVDTIKPKARARDLTVYLNANGLVSITPAMVNNGSADNCLASSSFSFSQATFTCADEGLNLEYFIITDANGNADSTSFLITVSDTVSPTIITRDITVQLGATGQVSIAASQLDSASTDNCSNQLFFSASKTTFNCSNLGTNTVTLTGTDVHGNTSSATAIVTVEDNLVPTVNTQSVTLTLNASGQATLTAMMVNNNSTDNCTIASMAISQSSFSCADLGVKTVALMVTDGSGNTASANATVTVIDNTAPTAVAQPVSLSLNANGNATLMASAVNNGSSDNCAVTSMSVSPNTFSCTNVGANTVTLTISDASGNTATTTTTVTVVDNTAPTVATRSISVNLNASGNASITAADVNNGSADACGIASVTVAPASFTCANLGANTVTITVTDANGNAATGTAVVTVNDNLAPIVRTKSFTAVLNASGQATIQPSDVDNASSDNCGAVTLSLDVATFTCNARGQNAVTLTATDASGNSASGTAIVSVVDNTAPTVSTQNITVQLNASGQASIQPSQINSGSTDNCSITGYSLNVSNFTCADIGTNTVTLTATDGSGNNATATAIVTVQDNVAPNAVAQNITVQLSATGSATITASSVNNGSTDACGISTLSISPNTFSCADLGSNSVILTVTDNNGNSSTATASVTVTDNLAPTVITQNATVYLNASGQASITAASVNNGSSDNCTVLTTSLSKTTFTCADRGQNLVTLTATDGSGNSASAGASVLVLDTISPSINNLPATITAYTNAQNCASNVTWPIITGNDNCTSTTVVTSQARGSAFNLGNTTVNVTVTDASGNNRVRSFMVTVIDTIAPVFTAVPNNITVTPNANSCDAVVTWAAPSANDNCSAATITSSRASGSVFNVGSTTVTYTATDAAGNSRNGTFVVTVTDQVAPTISNVPANLTVSNDAGSCNAVVNYAAPSVSDNCTGATIVSSNASGSLFPLGSTTVTFTATDGAGNTSTSSFTVTVQDTEAPVATSVPPSDTVGQCGAIYTYALPTGTDNCSSVTVRQTAGMPSGTVFPVGATINQYELVDAAGNRTFVNFTIVVIPQGVPQLPSLIEICANANPIDVTLGQNITWTGNGIVNNGTTFNPAAAGAGRHALSYVFTDDRACQVTGTIQVTVTPQPVKPVVSKIASNTLTTGNYNAYQWYRDGVLISGATSKDFTYSVGGNYQVVVGNSFACTNTSDGFVVGTSGGGIGLNEQILTGLELYPNPTNGIVNINLKVGVDTELSVTLFSIDGKKVFEQTGLKTNSTGNIRLELNHLPAATYFMQIRTENQMAVRKLLIN